MKFNALATVFLSACASTAAFQSPHGRTLSTIQRTNYKPQTFTNAPLQTEPNRLSTSLQAAPLAALSSITAPIGSISVLAFVILIHEGGHFLAARTQGIKVKEFSVGVGPKLAGFTRSATTSEDGEEGIEFNLRAIPLGGYVSFPENYNATVEYQLEIQANKKRSEIQEIIEKNREENGTSGILSMLKLALNKKAKDAERVAALQSMASDLGKKEQSNANTWWKNPFGGNKDSKKDDTRSIIINKDGTVATPPIDYYDDADLLQNRPPLQRALVLVGGVVFNILLAFTLYFGELTVGNGLQKPVFSAGAVVSSAPRVDSASVGLLERGDVILSYNGNPLSSDSPTMYTSQEGISNFITNIRGTSKDNSLHLSVLKVQSQKVMDVDIKPLPMDLKDASSPLSIGVNIAPNYVGKELVKASNPIEAVTLAAKEVTELTSQTARSIFSFLGGLIVSGGKAPAGTSLSGPIGVLKTGSDVVATNDVAAVIGFAAAISVNLAVVNSLPLPALDGGQLVFVISELLTGKKVDQRKQEEISSAALLFLLLVSASTAVGDISSLVR